MRDYEKMTFLVWVYFNFALTRLSDDFLVTFAKGVIALWIVSYLGTLYFLYVVRKYRLGE